MTRDQFQLLRSRLQKTQAGMAALLGVSRKAVESYEQGWRRIPANIERIAYFLLFKICMPQRAKAAPCWKVKKCPPAVRRDCVAFLAGEGSYCWFLTGKSCRREQELGGRAAGQPRGCMACDFFLDRLRRLDFGHRRPPAARRRPGRASRSRRD